MNQATLTLTVHYHRLEPINLNIIYVTYSAVRRVMHVYSRSRHFLRRVVNADHIVVTQGGDYLRRDYLAVVVDHATR